MTPTDRRRLNRIIEKAFSDPYPPELDSKGGRIAWRKERLEKLLDEEFGTERA